MLEFKQKLSFLEGKGEMASLTRDFDWSSTQIGIPELWHPTLKSFVATILHSKNPMFIWWGSDLIQFYNDEYRISLGKAGGKHPLALGQNGIDCWQEIWEIIKPLIDKVFLKKEGIWMEDTLVPIFRNGAIESVYWSFGYTPIILEDGEVGGVLVTCQETTGKVSMVKRLEESEERTRLAIEAAEIGTFDHDLRSDKLITSKRMNEIFGVDEFQNWNEVRSLIHLHDLSIKDIAIEKSRITSKLSFECRIITKNYEVKWIKVDAKVFFDLNGNPYKRIGTIIDITQSQNFIKQKDDFISIASHELKTPITTLKASLQVLNLIQDDPPSKTSKDLLFYCNNGVKRVDTLIDELLNVSKINQGQFLIKKKKFDIVKETKDLVDDFFKDVEIPIIIEGNEQLTIIADPDRINQVLTNLLNNALKYASHSKVIKISIVDDFDFVKVSVIDQGLGIAKEKVPFIFNRYFKVENIFETSGLGLGLFISAEIIKLHDGVIGVDTEYGSGSTFWFTLPLIASRI